MRIHVISDTHDEIDVTSPNLPAATGEMRDLDFVVLAGDIARGADIKTDKQIGSYAQCPVIRIAGNHEHYKTGKTVAETLEEFRNIAGESVLVQFLENDSVVLEAAGTGEQVKFIGSTLWTDFRVYEDTGVDRQTAMQTALMRMNDYRMCLGSRDRNGIANKLIPPNTMRWHEESVDYIVDELRKPFDGIRVVVTHHNPVPQCLNPVYQVSHSDRKLSPAFASDLSWIFEDDEIAPDLWISGHGHNTFNFEIGKTLMVSNPVGYRRENQDFDPYLVVDTEMLPRYRPGGMTP